MTQQSRKRLLWAVNALLAACATGAAAAAFLPVGDGRHRPSADLRRRAADKAAKRRIEPLSAYAVIYQRKLRPPLFEPKRLLVAPTAPPPSLPLRLIGTAVEPGNSYGIFHTKTGEVKMARVGESIQGAEVVRIANRLATLKFHGQLVTLTVEKERIK